jgi:hypothetical protein
MWKMRHFLTNFNVFKNLSTFGFFDIYVHVKNGHCGCGGNNRFQQTVYNGVTAGPSILQPYASDRQRASCLGRSLLGTATSWLSLGHQFS